MAGVEQNRYKTNNGCTKHLPQTGFALYCTSFCISWSKAENSWKKVAMVQCRTEKQKMFRKPMHKLIKRLKQMSKLILDKGENPPLDIRKCKMPIKQNHLNTSHIFCTRRDEILIAKYIYAITQWRKDMNIIFEWGKQLCSEKHSEQRSYKSRGKTHAFFTRYTFFHVFTSENMENTIVLVHGKTPITI